MIKDDDLIEALAITAEKVIKLTDNYNLKIYEKKLVEDLKVVVDRAMRKLESNYLFS